MSGDNASNGGGPEMDRRDFIKMSGGAGMALAGAGLGANAFGIIGQAKLNILFILTDQQHFDALSADGNPHLNTPAMDWIRRRGVSFRLSHCPCSVCSPSRSSIFTGRTASETSVVVNGKSIRPDIPNLGQWFSQESDYETLYAGKWHVPYSFTQFIDGFRVISTGLGGQGAVCDTSTSRACEAYIRNEGSSKPFLMVASFMQPHDICEWLRLNTETPETARYPDLADELPPLPDNFEYDAREPERVIQRRNGRDPAKGNWTKEQWRYYMWSYYRHIEMVDGEAGRILQALEDTGLDKNTVVIFTSDHGEGLASHQMVRKSLAYDEAMKVPLLVSWPGETDENRMDESHVVTGLDLVPTFCDIAGIKAPPNMRGASLRPLLRKGDAQWRDFAVTELPGNLARVVRTVGHKYISYDGDPVEQLFDMQSDPGETKNLFGDSRHDATVEEHRKMLRDWERHLDPAPGVDYADAWWRAKA